MSVPSLYNISSREIARRLESHDPYTWNQMYRRRYWQAVFSRDVGSVNRIVRDFYTASDHRQRGGWRTGATNFFDIGRSRPY